MGSVPSILIVDSNVGFASMLQESLEQDGSYHTTVTHNGVQALQAASDQTFDLAIVDLGIHVVASLDGATVVRKLREGQASIRLMVIPLTGDALPEELGDLDIQGTLPKPFFLPELPGLLGNALSKAVAGTAARAEVVRQTDIAEPMGTAAQSSAGVERPHVPQECSPQVLREMEGLAQEINAATVLLTRGGDLLCRVGRVRGEDVNELVGVIAESYRISGRAAEILGGEQRRGFEQSVEGDEQMLYSLSVVEDVILSAALSTDVALGMLRHHVRSAAKRIRDLVA